MQKTLLSRRQFLGTTGKVVVAATACKWMCGEACAAARPDICVAAVCGIYCGACSQQLRDDPPGSQCLGCRSTTRAPDYALQCEVKKCADAKQLPSCGLCRDYPCARIQAFFNDTPKYGLREKNLDAIRDRGLPAWLNEQKARWTCQKCKAPFGYGARACPQCGAEVYSDAEEFEAFKKAKAAKAMA